MPDKSRTAEGAQMTEYVITKEKPDTSGKFSFRYEYSGSENMMLLDSYDYLLLKKGFCLMQKPDGAYTLFSGDGVSQYRSLNEESIKRLTDSIVNPRVLLEKREINVGRYGAVMLDELDKTIAKGSMTAFDSDGAKRYALLMEPLRGYEKETAKGLDRLGEVIGSMFMVGAVEDILRDAGDPMLSYSAKPVLRLEPETPLHSVMTDIYLHLTDVMKQNTDGIIKDIDIEFLHDFRVSVRRTRSAMSLIRGVYNKELEKEFRARFRELGGLTGMARDMDVWLDRMDEYEAMLPGWLAGGMEELAVHFRETRSAEYKKLSAYLNSGDFDRLMDDWEKTLKNKKNISRKGRKDVLTAAKKSIRECFAEIEKQAAPLTQDSHSDAVHEIRIAFKKIRYLLEFFSSLFDAKKTAPMLKDMKVLQDSLGDHNDYYVQQLMLEDLAVSGKWSAKTSSACGFLTAVLAEKQAAERKRALGLIIGFMGYQGLFEELFS